MKAKKNHILVVDDEPQIVSILKDFLLSKGYEVDCASSAEEAFVLLKNKKKDLILLDMRLPGMQGKEAARVIKQAYPGIKILVVTGFAEESLSLDKEKILEGVLTKPVSLSSLYKKIMEILTVENTTKVVFQDEETKQGVILLKLFVSLALIDLLAEHQKNN